MGATAKPKSFFLSGADDRGQAVESFRVPVDIEAGMTKPRRRRKEPSPGFVPLRDLVPRNDPKGGAAQKTVFGERPPIPKTEEEPPFKDAPAERRPKPGHDRHRKKGART